MRFLTKTTSLLVAVAIFIGRGFAARDNSNFINESFRADSPSDNDIIDAVFGDSSTPQETAYTQRRSGNSCIGNNIDVEYYGTNTLPSVLASDTIYVLTGNQQLASTINFAGNGCTAVLGSGEIEITHDGSLGGANFFYSNLQTGIILDSMILDGDGTAHIGIVLMSNNNSTIHNLAIDSFVQNSIYIQNTNYATIEQVRTFDSIDGIFLSQTNNSIINDSYSFNNTNYGIYITNTSSGNMISNSMVFNNTSAGIYIEDGPYSNIHNSQIFNNNNGTNNGIGIYIDSDYTVIQNSHIYNNIARGIYYQNVNTGLIISSLSYNQRRPLWLDNSNIDLVDTTIANRSTNGIYAENSSNVNYYESIGAGLSFIRANTSSALNLQGGSTMTTGDSSSSNGLFNTGSVNYLNYPMSCSFGSYPLGSDQSLYDCSITTALVLPITDPYQKQPVRIGIGYHGEQHGNIFTYVNTALTSTTPNTDGINRIGDNSKIGVLSFQYPNNFFLQNGIMYTNELGTTLLLGDRNQPFDYIFTGDITTTIEGTVTNNINDTTTFTGDDGMKMITGYFYATQGMYSGVLSQEYLIVRYLDTTPPTIPQIVSPINGATYLGYDLQLTWLASTDTGAGVAEYVYELSTSSGFDTILYNGSTDQTTVTVTGIAPNNYYRRVQAVDNLGQASGRASTGFVSYNFDYFDITFDNTSFPTNSGQTVTVTGFDSNGDVVTGYQGTVTFSITGIDTAPNPDYNDFTLANDYTFTLSNSGSQTFIQDFVITHPGIYEVTVQDSNYPSRSGTTTITVIGEYPSAFSGTFDLTPAYTTGDVFLSFTGSQDSDFIIEGGVPTHTGTITPGTGYQTGLLSSLPDGQVSIQLTLHTGYYTYTITQTTILDTTAPVVTLVSPSNNFMSPQSQVSLSWSSDEAGSPSFSGYHYVISGTNNGFVTSGNTTNNSMSIALPDGDYVRTIYAHDKAGNIGSASRNFTVDTTAPDIVSASPTNQIVTVPFSFNRSVIDTGAMDYSLLTLYDSNGNIIAGPAETSQTTLSTSALGINGLPTGLYTRELTATDEAGNSATQQYMFGVSNAIIGQIDGSVSLDSLFGNVNFVNGTYYTNTTQLIAHIFANMAVTANINGDISPSQLGLSLTTPFPYITQAITLTNGDGQKNLSTTLLATGLPNKTVATSVILDTQDPSTPTIGSPTNGQTINGNVTFDWSDANDNSGIAEYERYISTNPSFTNVIASGSTTDSQMTLNTNTLSDTGVLYRQVVTYDNAGNSSTTNYSTFQYNGVITPADLVPNTFSFTNITNANLGQSYTSNSITISGLGTSIQVQAQVDTGKLYINNVYVGTTGMVSNGSIVKIELDAASDYQEINTATITISSLSRTFSITTKDEPGSVNDLDELQLTANPSNPEENERIDIRIRARDADGDIITNYEGTVEFSVEYLDGRVRRTPNSSNYTLDENEYTFDNSDNGDVTLQDLLRLRNDNNNYRLVVEDADAGVEGIRYFCLRSSNCDEEGSTNLSRTQRLQIGIIFTSLVDAYQSNPSNAILFFAALEDALTALINSSDILALEEEALRYFRDLTKSFLDTLGGTTTGGDYNGQIYVAPNGKQYRVSFDSARQAYTSPDFTVPKYYISLEAFQAHINANNAGSQAGYFINGSGIQTGGGGLLDGVIGGGNFNSPTGDVIIAPNGKVYRVSVSGGQYTSPDFIYPRQFPSYNALRDHIYTHNQ